MNSTSIPSLSPAAARLLLAFYFMAEQASYEDVVVASGIHDVLTLVAAKTQLRQLGFIENGPDGVERVILPERWRVPRVPFNL